MHQAYKVVKDQRGFTLMELLVVMFILSLVMGGLFTVLRWNFFTAYENVDSQIEGEAFRIFNSSLINDIQFAKDISITNETNKDTISYTALNGRVTIITFEADGAYRTVGTRKVKIASGNKFETGYPAVYFQPNGMVRFNFYASEAKALMFLTIRPIVFEKE